jgi:hypothetical protein
LRCPQQCQRRVFFVVDGLDWVHDHAQLEAHVRYSEEVTEHLAILRNSPQALPA